MEININKTLTVQDTSASVLSVERDNNNGKRASIIVTNLSASGVYVTIAVDSEAKDSSGIVLYPGGVWSDSRDGGYWPTQKQITIISSAPNAVVAIQERVVTL